MYMGFEKIEWNIGRGISWFDTGPSRLTVKDSKISATFLDQVIDLTITTVQNVFRMLLYGQSQWLSFESCTATPHHHPASNKGQEWKYVGSTYLFITKSHDHKKKGFKKISWKNLDEWRSKICRLEMWSLGMFPSTPGWIFWQRLSA